MRVIYNGVDLFFIETFHFDFEPVYDDSGVDYLYTRVSFLGRALVNGQAEVVNPAGGRPPFGGQAPGPFMSYNFKDEVTLDNGNPVFRPAEAAVTGVPPAGLGVPPDPAPTVPNGTGVDARTPSPLREIVRAPNFPLLTHQTVRHRLSTPRKKLYVFSGPGMETGSPVPGTPDRPPVATSVVTLESPVRPAEGEADFLCDCKNGPLPRLLNVAQSLNDQTLVVDWGCETFISEAPLNGVAPNGALLSNRFRAVHTIADDGYTTISVQGRAVFRTDLIFNTPDTPLRSPDVDRAFCMLPIPQGFVRENVQVAGLADVTGIEYTFSDRQVSVNFPAGPFARAAKISALHRQGISSTSANLSGGIVNAANTVWGLKAQRNFARDQDDAGGDDGLKALARAIRRAARPRRKGRPAPPPEAGP